MGGEDHEVEILDTPLLLIFPSFQPKAQLHLRLSRCGAVGGATSLLPPPGDIGPARMSGVRSRTQTSDEVAAELLGMALAEAWALRQLRAARHARLEFGCIQGVFTRN